MIGAIPQNAKNVTVNVVGVSVSLGTARENVDLARDRALAVVDYLAKHGVQGRYNVAISTAFDVTHPRSRASSETPVKTVAGKPLTTTTIAFETTTH